MSERMRVGVIGCGNICPTYLRVLRMFPMLEVVAVADLVLERARARADEFNLPKACSPDELLADPEVQVVLNLTVPKAHAPLNAAALQAGKHAYTEKPFGINRQEAQKVLGLAESKGLRVGGAPDTFLGAGLQTCRKLIDDGWIGEPVGATAFMLSPGHERWHPDPEFFYQHGGGPMLDMGPYYITALVSLLGPVRRVCAISRITRPTRLIQSEPKRGQIIHVETPTHIAGTMEFENGAIATVVMSFDVWAHRLPPIEIYGTEGTLGVPDPNGFGGPVLIRRANAREWSEVPLINGYTEQSRGLGLADMVRAIQTGRPHRASGTLAYHVLDVMLSFNESSVSRQHITIESRCERPAPLPMGLSPGEID